MGKRKVKNRASTWLSGWSAFQRVYCAQEDLERHYRNAIKAGISEQEARLSMEQMATSEIQRNNRYQVIVRPAPQIEGWPAMIHLSIRHVQRDALREWDHFQRIKAELVGAEHEAAELYPAEDRLVDESNQYHLWVLAQEGERFPVGFEDKDQIPSWVPETSEIHGVYQVISRPGASREGWPEIEHLEIRRRDRRGLRDWRDLQAIKNAVCGADREGLELYPATSRTWIRDNASHLWVLKQPEMRFPFGYKDRHIANQVPPMAGARQRPRNVVNGSAPTHS